MNRIYTFIILLLCSQYVLFSQNQKNNLNVKEFTLSNGLTVWVNEDSSQPKIIGSVIVKAGAKDSPNTGIAHYFEHIMFKGTNKIGTTHYDKEKVWLDSISQKYDELAATADEKARFDIQKEINDLSIKAAEYAIPNEFNRLISKYGGTKLNAGTSWDYTMYFNTFSPQYIRQWCEINSERLINPVFRMFQSELETVYEEKNMYADMLGSQAAEKILGEFFKPHPYQYPIIGSTEHLKNPQLSEMESFFKKYYVAGNMGLILSGDIEADSILPLLEDTFGKVQEGSVHNTPIEMPAEIEGRVNLKAKIPIPLIKANALLWRGVPSNHDDEVALNMVMSLLSNENKTGLLDKATIDGKLMMGAGFSLSMNDAGVIALLAVPNIPFQTYRSAQKIVFGAINKIKSGNISDETFESLKLEQQRNHILALESLDKRNQKMIEVFAKGLSWNEYLEQVNSIETITKEELVAVANKYLSDHYFDVKKKTGKYPNDKIEKPPFKSIETTNKNEESEYSKWLATLGHEEFQPRYLNFDDEGRAMQLLNNEPVWLYYTHHSMNEVFNLTLQYEVGSHAMPVLSSLGSYLNYIGTDKYSVDQLNEKLQQWGSTLNFAVTPAQFTVSVSGFDNHFAETVALVSHFLAQPKGDKSKLKKVVKEKKIEEQAIRKSSDELSKAMIEKVKYGEDSNYINRLSLKELKRLSAQEYIAALEKVLSTESNIHYSGSLSETEVQEVLKNNLPVKEGYSPTSNPLFKPGRVYERAQVYFYNDPKAAQSIVQGYLVGPVQETLRDKHLSLLFNTYFGSGMSSLLFQEIREFRSLAYRVSSSFNNPAIKLSDKNMLFNILLSTQADKTLDALEALRLLMQEIPLDEGRLQSAKEALINQAQSAYPDFREKTRQIAHYKMQGYEHDPNLLLVEEIETLSLDDMRDFYNRYIKNKPMVYVIVGNRKKIDMNALQQLGEVKELRLKDIVN